MRLWTGHPHVESAPGEQLRRWDPGSSGPTLDPENAGQGTRTLQSGVNVFNSRLPSKYDLVFINKETNPNTHKRDSRRIHSKIVKSDYLWAQSGDQQPRRGTHPPKAEEGGLLGPAGQEAAEEVGDGQAPGGGRRARAHIQERRPGLAEVDGQGGQPQHVRGAEARALSGGDKW